MTPRIEILPPKKFIGKRISTSLSENRTMELWRSFMPRLKEIKNRANTNLYSIQVFNPLLKFEEFNNNTIFEKWAAVEVTNLNEIPVDMEAYEHPGGKYAVFMHKGIPATFYTTLQYIYGSWLPASEYILDSRPHFEIMSAQYRPDDPNAEEEVWIPVKSKE